MPLADTSRPPSSPRRVASAAALLTLPIAAFYAILARFVVNIPMWDDYDAALAYLLQLRQLPSTSARWLFFLAAQHNDYKLYLVNGLFWLQFTLFGHAEFRILSTLTNLLVLPIALLLWKLFLPREPHLTRRLLLFFPIVCLLFQLNYAETLDWGVSNLQVLTAVLGLLLGLYALLQPGARRFPLAIVAMLFAIAASIQGFLLLPLGAWLFARRRQYTHLALWLTLGLLCALAYGFHYTPQLHPHAHIPVTQWLSTRLLFALSYLGNILPTPFRFQTSLFFELLPIALGLLQLIFWLWIARSGRLRGNPVIAGGLIVVLLTAALVTLGRADLGLTASLASRYRIYPVLLLCFAWCILAERFPLHHSTHRPLYLTAFTVATLFCLSMDAWGFHYLKLRRTFLQQGIAAYTHTTTQPRPDPVAPQPSDDLALTLWKHHAHTILDQAINANLYHPPKL